MFSVRGIKDCCRLAWKLPLKAICVVWGLKRSIKSAAKHLKTLPVARDLAGPLGMPVGIWELLSPLDSQEVT